MQKRLEENYASHAQEYFGEVLSIISEIAKARPFWKLPRPKCAEKHGLKTLTTPSY